MSNGRKMKPLLITALTIVLACTVIACGSDSGSGSSSGGSAGSDGAKGTIRVGSKDFTENLVVGELYALALEDAGYTVERKLDIAGSLVHTAITSDEIDLYPEYTGTGLLSILQMDLITDPQEVYDTVKREYDDQFDLAWLDQSQANDGQGLVIRTSVAQELNIYTISDLQANADKIRFASQGEFDQRDDGIVGLEKVYGDFNFASSTIYDNGLKYQVLENDQADVAPAYTTEGQLVNTEQFTLLEDDKQMWPPYYLAPVVQNKVLEQYPDIAEILNRVSATLDTETVTALNAKVDVDKEEYEDVAREYFESIK